MVKACNSNCGWDPRLIERCQKPFWPSSSFPLRAERPLSFRPAEKLPSKRRPRLWEVFIDSWIIRDDWIIRFDASYHVEVGVLKRCWFEGNVWSTLCPDWLQCLPRCAGLRVQKIILQIQPLKQMPCWGRESWGWWSVNSSPSALFDWDSFCFQMFLRERDPLTCGLRHFGVRRRPLSKIILIKRSETWQLKTRALSIWITSSVGPT